MKVTRTSIATGITRTLGLDITEEQLARIEMREDLIQNIVPHLSPSAREFLMTGITDEEWDQMWGEPDEDLDDEEPAF